MRELINRDHNSPNWDERALPISMVVLHYTGMQSGHEALVRLCDGDAKVSAHYLIEENGTVFQLVDETQRAWHAGQSHWRGITDVNSASVGIELVNPGHEWGYRCFTDEQIAALIPLLAGIIRRYDVPRANVVGHSDIAPQRKEDPGELFPWETLARYRLVLPRSELRVPSPFVNDGAFMLALERFGYDISDGPAAVRAFERRWRPDRIDGAVDAELSAILFALLLDRDEGRVR